MQRRRGDTFISVTSRIRLKCFFHKHDYLFLLIFFARYEPVLLARPSVYLSVYLSLAHRTSEYRRLLLLILLLLSFSLISTFQPRDEHFFFLPPPSQLLPHTLHLYTHPPFLCRAHFSLPSAPAESPCSSPPFHRHSAAHKGGLRAPVSSTYDPNPAPYFFERLEKHAVTAVRVIACAQGASRLSVCRGRHVGHPWVTR